MEVNELKYKDALEKSLTDNEYREKLAKICRESAINLEDAIYWMEADVDIEYVMNLSNMGYSRDNITKNYYKLLLKHN